MKNSPSNEFKDTQALQRCIFFKSRFKYTRMFRQGIQSIGNPSNYALYKINTKNVQISAAHLRLNTEEANSPFPSKFETEEQGWNL